VGVLALVAAALALVGPVWTLSLQGASFENQLSSTTSFGLLGWMSTGIVSGPGGPLPNTTTVASGSYASLPLMGTVVTIAALLTGGAAVADGGVVILVIDSGKRPALRRAAMALGLVAFALLLASAITVATQLPGAASQDPVGCSVYVCPKPPLSFVGFWGSSEFPFAHGGETATWGAGWGWYAGLAAALLMLAELVLLLVPSRCSPRALDELKRRGH
jgi:hypothetical protein